MVEPYTLKILEGKRPSVLFDAIKATIKLRATPVF